MNLTASIFVIAAGIVAIGGAIGSGVRWIYMRGKLAGREEALREADARVRAETDAKVKALEMRINELEAERPKRRRI